VTELTINLVAPSDATSILIYDLQGREMILPIIFQNNQAKLNTSSLPDGFYTIQIINFQTGTKEIGSFIKEK
jgi:Secretion system C-terminal sorting domain